MFGREKRGRLGTIHEHLYYMIADRMSEQSRLDQYRLMVRLRAFEDVCLEGVASGEIHGELHTSIGHEAVAAGMAPWLRDGDAMVSTHRNHYHALVKGVPPRDLLAEIFERETGLCRGR